MKKLFVVLALVLLVSTAGAKIRKTPRRSLVEIGPKASLYIGDETRFGIGADVLVNPLRNLAVRFGITEVSFGDGGTWFTLNQGFWYHGGSLDALIYLPMRGMQPYVHAGFGLTANGDASFLIRGGMGFDYTWAQGTDLFVEPGIIIIDPGYGDTDFVFRLTFGAKFGLLK